jgi:hypothetical protein
MFGGTAFFVGLAAFFFYVYGRHKTPQKIANGTTLEDVGKLTNV